jgi:hypothetical protein
MYRQGVTAAGMLGVQLAGWGKVCLPSRPSIQGRWLWLELRPTNWMLVYVTAMRVA